VDFALWTAGLPGLGRIGKAFGGLPGNTEAPRGLEKSPQAQGFFLKLKTGN
jgi:hypothetical protein